MGKRWVYSRQAVAPYPWQQALVFIIMALTSMLAYSEGCKVEQCWHRYNNAMETEQITRGANRAFCIVLNDHSECIRATARSCRGDLKYHSTYSLVSQWNNEFNCSYVILHAENVPPVTKPPKPRPTGNHACTYHGKHDYQHCSLFGDPHLRTFNNDFQTCKVLGAWPLIDNAYLAVQVTNDAVGPPFSNATAPTKVTVLIKGGNSACAQHKTYEAQVGNLPSAFIDGTQISGSDRTVRIKEKETGHHIEIVIRYIATTIVVRQVGNYLAVAMRMPKDVINQGVNSDGLQLCVKGCPLSELINYKEFLARHQDIDPPKTPLSRSAAVAKCKENSLTDFYLDACVFDLMTTGDTSFSQTANKAMHDLKNLNPTLFSREPNRTDLEVLPTYQMPTKGSDGPQTLGDTSSAPSARTSGSAAALTLMLCMMALVIARPHS